MSQKMLAFQATEVIPFFHGIAFKCNIGIFVLLNTKKYFFRTEKKIYGSIMTL